jgi:hypothetical protein
VSSEERWIESGDEYHKAITRLKLLIAKPQWTKDEQVEYFILAGATAKWEKENYGSDYHKS